MFFSVLQDVYAARDIIILYYFSDSECVVFCLDFFFPVQLLPAGCMCCQRLMCILLFRLFVGTSVL